METPRVLQTPGEPVAEPLGTVARNAFHLVLGQIASTIMAIAFSAVLGRSLGAHGYGLYYLITTLTMFAFVIVEWGQPLVVLPVDPKSPPVRPLLRVEPEGVMVTSLKPSDDGKALMLRLFNVGTAPAKARVVWSEPGPKRVALSSPKEEEGPAVTGPVEMPPGGIATLRAALPE